LRGRVVVTKRDEFDGWLASMPTFSQARALAKADAAAGAGQYAVCPACHGQNGEGNPALNAPVVAGPAERGLVTGSDGIVPQRRIHAGGPAHRLRIDLAERSPQGRLQTGTAVADNRAP